MRKKKNAGRPVTNHRLAEIMRDRGCSRQWAYVLLRRERALDAEMSERARASEAKSGYRSES
jgi:hypothetical protein